MTDAQRTAYFAQINRLKEAHQRAKQLRENEPEIKPAEPTKNGRLGTLVSLASHVGALKMKALMSPEGLRKKQAWRAYFAQAKKLKREREAFEKWLARASSP